MSSTHTRMSSLSATYQEDDRKLPWLSDKMHSLERPPSVPGSSQPSLYNYMESNHATRPHSQDQTLGEVCHSLQSPPDSSLFSDIKPLEPHGSILTYDNQTQDQFHPIDSTLCYLGDGPGYHGNLLNHHGNTDTSRTNSFEGHNPTIESMVNHGGCVAMSTGANYGQFPSLLHRLEDRLRYKINIHFENVRAELQDELYKEFGLYRQSLGGVHSEYFDKCFPRHMSIQSEHAQTSQETAGDMNSVNSSILCSGNGGSSDQSGTCDLQHVDWSQVQVEEEINICLIRLLTCSAAINSSLQGIEYSVT